MTFIILCNEDVPPSATKHVSNRRYELESTKIRTEIRNKRLVFIITILLFDENISRMFM